MLVGKTEMRKRRMERRGGKRGATGEVGEDCEEAAGLITGL